jgi:orotidine-5'-phosphate decarboxylase
VHSGDEALDLADRLEGLEWVKLGPMLFLREGRGLVDRFKQRGIRVFLDLKWHDIPNSVAEAARAAAEMGVDLGTVHSLGGTAMVRAAVEAAGAMRIAAVTVLTSHGEGNPLPFGPPLSPRSSSAAPRAPAPRSSTPGSPSRPSVEAARDTGDAVRDEVLRLARLAVDGGVGALVASPLEVSAVRQAVGAERWIVTPGIRPAGADVDDQQRFATPESAVAAGATHLVVGRPITRAESPAAVYHTIREALS